MTTTTPADDLTARFRQLPPEEKKKAAKSLQQEASGIFDVDKRTRTFIWIAIFVILLVLGLGALFMIWHSWDVSTVTTTGTGAKKVTVPLIPM
jgi:hypothetical protein